MGDGNRMEILIIMINHNLDIMQITISSLKKIQTIKYWRERKLTNLLFLDILRLLSNWRLVFPLNVLAPDDDLGIFIFCHDIFFLLWKILSKMRIKNASENDKARIIKATTTVLKSIGVPESVSGFRQSTFLALDLVHFLIIFLMTPFWYNFESLGKNC